MHNWFTVESIDDHTFVISEYEHPEETHAYLLNGNTYSLLIDTGLGIFNIYEEVIRLTNKPIIAVITHAHFDHMGGLRYFPNFYVHELEVDWITKQFPLSLTQVKEQLMNHFQCPTGFQIDDYQIFQGIPKRILHDDDLIDLGGRTLQVIHTPGHSPGHMCFYELQTGYMFTGDLIYKGTLYANYPSTDPDAYLTSLEKLTAFTIKRILPGHHSLQIRPEIVVRMRNALRLLQAEGNLHHGSGTFEAGDYSIKL